MNSNEETALVAALGSRREEGNDQRQSIQENRIKK